MVSDLVLLIDILLAKSQFSIFENGVIVSLALVIDFTIDKT